MPRAADAVVVGGGVVGCAALRRYLRTFSPRYDPAEIEIPPRVDARRARYSALGESGRA